MTTIDGYMIKQEPGKNRIVIIMPQTPRTVTTTVAPMVNRRIELTADEEAMVLGFVRSLIEVDGIRQVPSTDVAPVKHGRLTINVCKVGGYDYAYYKCTACGRLRPLTPFQFDFCPFCGARMDQGDNDGEIH